MNKWLTALLMALLLASCHGNTLVHSYQPVAHDGWNRQDTLCFQLPTAAEGDYQLTIGLRLWNNYPYQELWMVVEQRLEAPIYIHRDTIAYALADSTGNLSARGTNLLQYETEALPLHLSEGQHGTLRLYHLMKRETVTAISDVGIRISR